MPFVDVIDAQRAAEYVQDQLSGGTTLANVAVRSIDLSRGSYRVAMPVGMKLDQGMDFR